jgi:HEPN domain-containing protein
MNDVVREWLAKAEGDYATALRECRARKAPNYDAVCFHAQQCIEKYLKGFLQARGVAFAKTHSLPVLLDQCLTIRPMWEVLRNDLNDLTRYAVQFRYPGESADKGNAKAAVRIMKRCRLELRETFTLNGRKNGNSASGRARKAGM